MKILSNKKYIRVLLIQIFVIFLAVLVTYTFLDIQKNQEKVKNQETAHIVLPTKNLMVYTRYTDPGFKSSTGHVFTAEFNKPSTEQVIYDFKENEEQRLNRLLGVANKKVFYLLHYPTKNSLELGYIDLQTNKRQVIAQPKGYPDEKTVFFDTLNKKVYYPSNGGLYMYDVASSKQVLLLESDQDSATEDDVFVTFADSEKAYLLNMVHVGRDDTVNSVIDLKTQEVEVLDQELIRPVFSVNGKKVAYFEDVTANKFPTQRSLKIKYLDGSKILDLYKFTYTGEGPIAAPTVVSDLAFSMVGNRFSFSVGIYNPTDNQYSYTGYISLIDQYKFEEKETKTPDNPQGARSITLLPEFDENTHKKLNKVENIPHDYEWGMAYIPKGEVFAGSKQEAKIYTVDEITYLDLENAFLKYPLLIRAKDLLFVSDP